MRSRQTGAGAGATPVGDGAVRRVSVLGATGSIGQSTLDLIGRSPDRYQVVALTAQTNVAALAALARQHRAECAVIGDASRYAELEVALAGTGIAVAAGADAVVEAAVRPADCVVAAIVGAAGLLPTLAAVRCGRRVALANKECLVSAGDVFMRAVDHSGAELIPVDSEHSAAFQAIGSNDPASIERITLTASGGPFLRWDLAQLANVSPEQAVRHPIWSMGRKISIDSATLMNKGLELIEAFHLFPVQLDQLAVLVHPQSIVHCLVSFSDGSVLAQLSYPDMRTPISLSLSWPRRAPAPTERLDLARIGTLTFEAPDEVRFPALALARDALRRGGSAPAVLNAANEVAVEAFLAAKLKFLDIVTSVERCLAAADRQGLVTAMTGIDDVVAIDGEARRLARSLLTQ